MEQIKNLLPKAVEGLERPTKVNPRNTKTWGSFDQFKTLSDPQLEQAKEAAVSFADDILNQRSPHWLSLLGSSGAGKTMLAKTIWQLFRQNFHMTIHWDKSNRTQSDRNPWGQIVRWRGGFLNWGNAINKRMLQGDYDFLEDLRSYDFFVIDDIISEYEKHRQLSAAKLYDVFQNRLGKWTVITANASLEQIGLTLDPRIASRMIRDNSVVIDLDVPDFNVRGQSVPKA